MSSSTKDQTIDGYVTEFCNSHHCSPLQAMQTVMVGNFIQSVEERDAAIYCKKKGEKK